MFLTQVFLWLFSVSFPTVADCSSSSLKYVTLEEHWLSPALQDTTLSEPVFNLLINGSETRDIFLPHLLDLGPLRLANMTANNIRKQIVSHATAPKALANPPLMRLANDQLAAAIANNTHRFAAFATLPMALPHAAAAELRRCVHDLDFRGALIDHRLPNGTYYDGDGWRPFWAAAEALGVPIYLHPTLASVASVTDIGHGIYAPAAPGDYSLFTAADLALVAWSWHQDVGLHFLRLYAAGVFEDFPRLKVVLGHVGEVVPYMLERADGFLSRQNASRASVKEVWARNVWVTTAGFFSLNPMGTLLRNTAVERIMYSVDYPFSNAMNGSMFMAELKTSGLVTEEEWEAIAYKNAERFLGV